MSSTAATPTTPTFETYVGFLKEAASPRSLMWTKLLEALTGSAVAGGAAYGTADLYGASPEAKAYTAGLAAVGGFGVGHHTGKTRWLAKNFDTVKKLPDFAAKYPTLAHLSSKDISKDVLGTYTKGVLTAAGADAGANILISGGQAGIHAMNASTDLNKSLADKTRQAGASAAAPRTGIMGMLDKYPGGALGAGVTAAVALPAVAALYQISRAAGVVGDGRSLRLSASLRKRRGQATDLNFGLAPYSAPKDVAKTNPMAGRLADTGVDDDVQYLDEE